MVVEEVVVLPDERDEDHEEGQSVADQQEVRRLEVVRVGAALELLAEEEDVAEKPGERRDAGEVREESQDGTDALHIVVYRETSHETHLTEAEHGEEAQLDDVAVVLQQTETNKTNKYCEKSRRRHEDAEETCRSPMKARHVESEARIVIPQPTHVQTIKSSGSTSSSSVVES